MNYLGFKEEEIIRTSKALNELLANYHIYYQNLRNFHWNIAGENFFDLHIFFEDLYNDARLKVDGIAERILTLRRRPISRMEEYLQIAEIEEPAGVKSDHDMVKYILDNHRILIQNMRKVLNAAADTGDEGTIDMIGGFLADIEKKSWMLDAWASKKEVAVSMA